MTIQETVTEKSVVFKNPDILSYYEYRVADKTLTMHYYMDPDKIVDQRSKYSKEHVTIVYYDVASVDEARYLLNKIQEFCKGNQKFLGYKQVFLLLRDLNQDYMLGQLRYEEAGNSSLSDIKTEMLWSKNPKRSNYIITKQDNKIKSYRFVITDYFDSVAPYLKGPCIVHNTQLPFTFKQNKFFQDKFGMLVTILDLHAPIDFDRIFQCTSDQRLYTKGMVDELELNGKTRIIYHRINCDKIPFMRCAHNYEQQFRCYSRLLQPKEGKRAVLVKKMVSVPLDGVQRPYTAYCNKDYEKCIKLYDGVSVKPQCRLLVDTDQQTAIYMEGARLMRNMEGPLQGTYDKFLQILAQCMGWQLIIEDAN